jgi:hypothetical protein
MTFSGCKSLKKVHNLNKVKFIGELSFSDPSSGDGCPLEGKIWIDSCEGFYGFSHFSGCKNITEVVLKPTNTPNISDRCFQNCESLEKVYNLNKVKKIGMGAFIDNNLSGKIWIDSCESLHDHAFDGCSSISEVVLSPTNTPDIPNSCFRGCASLGKVHNLNKVKKIGEEAFSNFHLYGDACPLEGKIWIDSCTELGNSAFAGCINIEEVVLSPTNTPNIPSYCFANCPSLTKVHNLNKVKFTGANAFSGSGLTGKIWIDSCESFAEYIFDHCRNITDIVLKQEVYDSIKDSLTNYAPEGVNWIPVM